VLQQAQALDEQARRKLELAGARRRSGGEEVAELML
jgi:hypothetical protein